MKKILFAIVSIFALVGCSYDDVESIIPTVPADGTVAVQLGVQVPEMQSITRSMADQAIKSLHLVVFDENGYFVEAVEAKVDGSSSWEDKATLTENNKINEGTDKDPDYKEDASDITKTEVFQNYSVELTQSAQPRIVHFIANSPLAIDEYKYGSERELINALETSDGADAYWQRKELESILGNSTTTKTVDGKPVTIVVAEEGSKLAGDLSMIPLVRNFAKISVNNLTADNPSKGNFVYEGIAIYNAPTKGKVAPYNTNAGEYAAYNHDIDYATLTSAGYYGYEPASLEFTNTGFAPEQYIYEFKHSGKTLQARDSYPFVIIKGKYNNGTSSYYKVDLTYKVNKDDIEPVYYNILRNFNYVININYVGSDGYAEPEDAAAAAASNNISASVDTRNLLNISDGQSALYVEYINKFLTAQGTVTLKYKYVPDISADATSNGDVVVTKGAGGDTGDVINGAISNDQATNGWATISFNTTGIGDDVKNQSIILSAGALSREVKYTLRKPFALQVDCPAEVSQSVAAPLTVDLKIPAELPDAIFPLEFVIVSDKMSISPDATQENMPVKTGLNAQGQEVAGGQYFGFVKTVTYDEYVNRDANGKITGYNTTIPCHFKTALAQSDSNVSAYNHYFNIASDRFETNPSIKVIKVALSENASFYGADRTVTAEITIPGVTSAVDVAVELEGLTHQTGAETLTTTYNTTTGKHTLNFTTSDWGTTRKVTVRYTPSPSDYTYIAGSATAKVNKVEVGAGKVTLNNIDYANYNRNGADTAEIVISYNGTQIGEFTVSRGSGGWTDQTGFNSAAFGLTIENLANVNDCKSMEVTVSYTTSYTYSWMGSTTVTEQGEAPTPITIGKLLEGTTISFTDK